VALESEGYEGIIALYDIQTGQRIARLTKPSGRYTYSIHDAAGLICTCVVGRDDKKLLQLWELETGKLVRQREISTADSLFWPIAFSEDGTHLYETTNPKPTIFRVSDLRELDVNEGQPYHVVYATVGTFWSGYKAGTTIWQIDREPPRTYPQLRISEGDWLVMNPDCDRVLVCGERPTVDLWDLKTDRHIAQLQSPGELDWAGFDYTGQAISVRSKTHLSIYNALSGQPIVQNLHEPADGMVSYNPAQHQIHIWTSKGEVLRYTEGRSYCGYFVPVK
jgi:WD40 repeat protein